MAVEKLRVETDFCGIKVTWEGKKDVVYQLQVFESKDKQSVSEIIEVHGSHFLYHPEDTIRLYKFKVWEKDNPEKSSMTNEHRLCTSIGNGLYIDVTRKLNERFDVFWGIDDRSIKQREVAIKIIETESPKVINREIKMLCRVDNHQNIISYLNSSEPINISQAFIAVQMCRPITLYEIMEKYKKIPFRTLKTIMLHLAHGLFYLQKKDILHRNLNPSTIWLSNDGKYIQISEFGLSKEMKIGTSTSGNTDEIKMDGWRPADKAKTKKFDVFSLGTIFYYILTGGSHPFGDDLQCDKNIEEGNFNLDELDKVTDSGLAKSLITKMIDKEENKRHSIEEVLKHPLFCEDSKKIGLCTSVLKSNSKSSVSDTSQNLFQNWKEKIGKDSPLYLKMKTKVYEDSITGCIQFLHNIYLEQDVFNTNEGLWRFFSTRYPSILTDALGETAPLNEIAPNEPLDDFDLPTAETVVCSERETLKISSSTIKFAPKSFWYESLVRVKESIPNSTENMFPITPLLECSTDLLLKKDAKVKVMMDSICYKKPEANDDIELLRYVDGVKTSQKLTRKNIIVTTLSNFRELYFAIKKEDMKKVTFEVHGEVYHNNFCEIIPNFHIKNDFRYLPKAHLGFKIGVEFNSFSAKLDQDFKFELFCKSGQHLNKISETYRLKFDENLNSVEISPSNSKLHNNQGDLPSGPVVARIMVGKEIVDSQTFSLVAAPSYNDFLFV